MPKTRKLTETTIKYAKEDIPRSIRNSDHLTGEIGFVVKESRSAYGKRTSSNSHQERIANRLSVPQRTLSDHLAKMPSLAILLNADLSNHLPKMPELAKLVNTDLSKGFTVSQVAEKHGWTEMTKGESFR